MIEDDQKNSPDRKKESEKSDAGTGETCRCKQTAEMKPRQLLNVMIGDLAFWKKKKKG
jgi:hypothetical protein